MQSALSIGTDQLRFVLNNSSQANWGCLDAVHLGGDPAPTPNGVLTNLSSATPLWQLTVSACNESFPSGAVLQSCTAACRRKYAKGQTASSATLRWEGCVTPFAGATLDVEVNVSVTKGTSTWAGSVAKPAGLCLQSFTLPDLRTLRVDPAPDGGRPELFFPRYFGAQGSCDALNSANVYKGSWMPEVCARSGTCAEGSSREQSWMPNGDERSMSFTAWLSSGTPTSRTVGLYVGAHDPTSRLKMMPVGCLGAGGSTGLPTLSAGLRALHVPESFGDAAAGTFVLPYPVVVAAFGGGAWDAAQVYRAWALSSAVWTRKGKLGARTDVPPWMLGAPLWLRLSAGVEPTPGPTDALVETVREVLGNGSAVTELGVHWYSWNTEHFDSKYPVYTAQPGFGAALQRMQQPHAGVTARIVPYTNGRIWDPTDGLDLSAATCNGRNGTGYHEEYNSGVRFTVMDPAKPLMQATWSDAVGDIATRYNTSGVYTDQVSCSHAEACYDAAHGTNASGWAAGSRAMLASMAAKVGAPRRGIISEAHDESYMSDLHAYLSIYGYVGPMGCTTTLAWQAVYGGYAINVGDMRWPPVARTRDAATGLLRFNETEAAAYRAIAAQGLASGGVMGWFVGSAGWLNGLGLAAADAGFLRSLSSAKVSAAQYLTHGRLWRSPRWLGPPPPTMKLHDYGYETKNASQFCETPLLLAECWRADDGSFAVVAVNHGTEAFTLNVTVDLAESGEPERWASVEAAAGPLSVEVHVVRP